ncbi:MAG TPA: hypothetical protein PLL92_11235, partial [Alicycliphilus sp.]|nr:hypothetical protein [Alicycliphilus sp.]
MGESVDWAVFAPFIQPTRRRRLPTITPSFPQVGRWSKARAGNHTFTQPRRSSAMASTINTNVASLTAQRNLGVSQG